jgi:hypothetical protein
MDDGSVDRDAACAVAPVPALPAALDMYLMIDRSGTMGADCDVGSSRTSRWCYAVNALAGFFAAPTSNGIGVALGFTPHGSCTWTNPEKTAQSCCAYGECCLGDDDTVPEVERSELPASLTTLTNRLNEQIPNGTTSPLEAALRGLTRYTAAAKRADRQMVGVIMTDGDPNGCVKDIATLSSILTASRTPTGPLTFVIGMTGADYGALETLALAGGATPHDNHCATGDSPCHYYDVGDGNPRAFVDALQQIQRSTVGCRFSMPTTDVGVVDPNTLAVEWSSPSEPVRTRLTRRDSVDDCGSGWYPTDSGQFALCPETCDLVQSIALVEIDILAGCLGS